MAISITRRSALAAGVSAAALPMTASAATMWQAYTYIPVATVASAVGFRRLIDNFEKQTDHAVNISMHLGGSLPIKATNITQAVAQSVVQLADDGFGTGNVPITAVLRLPLLLLNLEEMKKAMAILLPYIQRDYGKKGIVVLGQYTYPFQVIWGRKKITSLADLKGLKMRVTSVEEGQFIRAFGGTPITMGTPEVAAALDRGVVDGALTASSGGGREWEDLLHWRYGFPTSFVNSTYVVNKSAYDRLTPKQQTILHQVSNEAATWTTAEMQRQEDAITAQMAKHGMVVTPASKSDIHLAVEKMRPYWPRWAKAHGPEAEEVLKKIRTALGR